jgi:hypothetical protein
MAEDAKRLIEQRNAILLKKINPNPDETPEDDREGVLPLKIKATESNNYEILKKLVLIEDGNMFHMKNNIVLSSHIGMARGLIHVCPAGSGPYNGSYNFATYGSEGCLLQYIVKNKSDLFPASPDNTTAFGLLLLIFIE